MRIRMGDASSYFKTLAGSIILSYIRAHLQISQRLQCKIRNGIQSRGVPKKQFENKSSPTLFVTLHTFITTKCTGKSTHANLSPITFQWIIFINAPHVKL